MALERLDKLLASTGRWSRKEVKDLVRQGRVLADGHPVLRPEEKWDPEEAELTVDGQRVDCAPFVYLMLHKPAGLLSATEDRNQRTSAGPASGASAPPGPVPGGAAGQGYRGAAPPHRRRPAGARAALPKRHVDKVYLAYVDGVVDQSDVEALARGMVLGDGLHCLPAGLEPLEDGRACLVTLRGGSTTR